MNDATRRLPLGSPIAVSLLIERNCARDFALVSSRLPRLTPTFGSPFSEWRESASPVGRRTRWRRGVVPPPAHDQLSGVRGGRHHRGDKGWRRGCPRAAIDRHRDRRRVRIERSTNRSVEP